MYNSSGLIPARFLILISHFIICVILLWNKEENMKGCLMALEEKMNMDNRLTQLVTGLSLMLSFLCFEMLAFVFGLTMFNTDSALLSIGGHSLACICLTGLILNEWHCGWFWWIFSFGAALPFIHDTFIALDVLINKKY